MPRMALFWLPQNKQRRSNHMTNLYTIKARLAELREELMNHAAAWSDVPGGADNPIAQAEYARIWKISIHAPRAGGDC